MAEQSLSISEMQKFMCDECQKLFASKYSLTRHMKNLHSQPTTTEPGYLCDKCDKRLSTKYSLGRHVKNIHNK